MKGILFSSVIIISFYTCVIVAIKIIGMYVNI